MTAGRSAHAVAVGAVEDEIRLLLHRVKRVIGTRAHAVHPDLQGPSYLLLAWLASNQLVRASAIADALAIDKGALSRQLQHLETLGLVRRTPDPDDGRATLVAATPEALRRLEVVDGEQRMQVCERLGDWPVTDLEGLAERLSAYNRALS